jgi:hypothetical protein
MSTYFLQLMPSASRLPAVSGTCNRRNNGKNSRFETPVVFPKIEIVGGRFKTCADNIAIHVTLSHRIPVIRDNLRRILKNIDFIFNRLDRGNGREHSKKTGWNEANHDKVAECYHLARP